MDVILLQRVAKLGQMGDDGSRQKRLCAQFPAADRQGAARDRSQQKRFQDQKVELEARNLQLKSEASRRRRKARGPELRHRPSGG